MNEDLTITLRALDQSTAAFASLNKNLNDLKKKALEVGTALLGALALKDVVNTMEQTAIAVRGIQAETGLAAEQASRLAFAANVVGVSTDELNTALGRLDKNMFSTATLADKGKDLFTKWGIAIEDARGNTKNFADVFQLVADRIKQLGDGPMARAAEMDLFGRAGGRLHDLLMLGAEGIKKLYEMSDRLGQTIDDKTLGQLIEFTRGMKELGKAAEGLKLQLGILLLPILTFVITALTNLAAWINANILRSREFAGVLKVVGEVLQRVFGLFKELAGAVQRFVGEISSKGLLGALKDLAGDIGKAAIKFLGDIGDKLDSLGPMGTLAKDALIAIGSLAVISSISGAILKIKELIAVLTAVKTIQTISFVLVAVAVEETMQTIQMVTDRWDTWVRAVHQGLLNNQNDGNNFGRTFIRGLVGWGDDFSALGTNVRNAFDAVAYAIKTLFANAEDVVRSSIQNLIVLVDQLILKINEISGSHIPTIPGVSQGGGSNAGSGGPPPGAGSGGSDYVTIPGVGRVTRSEQALAQGCESTPGYQWNWSAHNCFYAGGPVDHTRGRPFAAGGIVMPRPGGTQVTVGEGGQAEAIIPLGKGGGAGNVYNITVNASGNIGLNERELADMVGDRVLAKLASFRAFSF